MGKSIFLYNTQEYVGITYHNTENEFNHTCLARKFRCSVLYIKVKRGLEQTQPQIAIWLPASNQTEGK